MKSDVLTFKARQHFREHLEKKAQENGMPLGTYIKAALAKVSKYKEPKREILV